MYGRVWRTLLCSVYKKTPRRWGGGGGVRFWGVVDGGGKCSLLHLYFCRGFLVYFHNIYTAVYRNVDAVVGSFEAA